MRARLRRRAVRISSGWVSTESGSDRLPTVDGQLEVALTFTDDEEVRSLNASYRGKDETTDVLSFALDEAEGPPTGMLGDIVISVEQAERQAPDGDLETELLRLLVHGFCHLVGHDHHRAAERKTMAALEARLLAPYGVGSGLIARAG